MEFFLGKGLESEFREGGRENQEGCKAKVPGDRAAPFTPTFTANSQV